MYFRAGSYLIMAVIIWLSLVWGASTLILPALTLSLTAIFYGIASFRHEDRETSIAAGGKNAHATVEALRAHLEKSEERSAFKTFRALAAMGQLHTLKYNDVSRILHIVAKGTVVSFPECARDVFNIFSYFRQFQTNAREEHHLYIRDTALVGEVLGRAGRVTDALRILNDSGANTNLFILNALISVYMTSPNTVPQALSIWEKLGTGKNPKANATTYSMFIRGYADLKDAESARKWFAKLETELAPADPPLKAYAGLIQAFANTSNPQGAQEVFAKYRIRHRGSGTSTMMSILLQAYLNAGDLTAARALVDRMLEREIMIQPTVYAQLIDANVVALGGPGSVEALAEARRLFTAFPKDRTETGHHSEPVYAAMIRACKGHADDIWALWKEARMARVPFGETVSWPALVGALDTEDLIDTFPPPVLVRDIIQQEGGGFASEESLVGPAVRALVRAGRQDDAMTVLAGLDTKIMGNAYLNLFRTLREMNDFAGMEVVLAAVHKLDNADVISNNTLRDSFVTDFLWSCQRRASAAKDVGDAVDISLSIRSAEYALHILEERAISLTPSVCEPIVRAYMTANSAVVGAIVDIPDEAKALCRRLKEQGTVTGTEKCPNVNRVMLTIDE
ncbi:hypothetical protein HDU93_008105 [Gonapodya sp. JEL0774]|nr:hypothetical protein HDU93_008105 [Gonapodya sp. JEL0774]